MITRRLLFPAYCLLLCLLAALAAEYLLLPRLFQLPRAALLNGFIATPGSTIDGQQINSMGYTGDAISTAKPANTVRVLLLGSSSLFNRHLGERLKAALQQQTSRPVELVDAGIRSHTSRADLIKLHYLAGFHFDYILFYDSINDLWANHVAPTDYRSDYSHLDVWYQRSRLLDHSLLARYSYNMTRGLIQRIAQATGLPTSQHYQFVFPEKPWLNAAGFASVASYRDNIRAIVQLSRQTGATPVLLTFASHLPDNYTRQDFISNRLDYVNPDHYDQRDVYNWGSPTFVREGLQKNNEVLKTVAQQQQVALIDIDSEMSQHNRWFGDVCHFNDDGVEQFNRIVASRLFTIPAAPNR